MDTATDEHNISPTTILRYLCGRRDAILTLSRSRQTLVIGMLFVLSAGFAREYDGEDLLTEPWHLVIPFVASLTTSLLLYCLVRLVGWRRGISAPAFATGYRDFLGLFWMTAPLAWLYAIPCERFLTAGDATRFNLILLGAVSVWRVVLMMRVIIVVYGALIVDVVMIVMLFADVVMLAALEIVPQPILQVMGGIRMTESETLIMSTGLLLRLAGYPLLLVWLVGVLIAMFRRHRWNPPALVPAHPQPIAATWRVAVLSVGIWLLILPLTQPAQIRRSRVESAFASGDIRAGIRLMSASARSDFPPHWDPPPRYAYGQHKPSIVDLMRIVSAESSTTWVRELFLGKFRWRARQAFDSYMPFGEDQLTLFVEVLEELPADEWRSDELDKLMRERLNDNAHSRPFLTRLQNLLDRSQAANASTTASE